MREQSRPGSEPGEAADRSEAVEIGYHFAQFAGARRPEQWFDQRIEFGGEALSLRRNIGSRNPGVLTSRNVPSVGEIEFELAQGLRPVVLPVEMDALAQRDQTRIPGVLRAVGAEACRVDPGQGHRHRLAQAE